MDRLGGYDYGLLEWNTPGPRLMSIIILYITGYVLVKRSSERGTKVANRNGSIPDADNKVDPAGRKRIRAVKNFGRGNDRRNLQAWPGVSPYPSLRRSGPEFADGGTDKRRNLRC